MDRQEKTAEEELEKDLMGASSKTELEWYAKRRIESLVRDYGIEIRLHKKALDELKDKDKEIKYLRGAIANSELNKLKKGQDF